MSVEASRRHGPFDLRWQSAGDHESDRAPSAPHVGATEAAGVLDWNSFSTRYFPGRRRHDLHVLGAYRAYKRNGEWQHNDRASPPKLRLVPDEPDLAPSETDSEAAGASRLLAAVAVWEGEGGSTGGRHD